MNKGTLLTADFRGKNILLLITAISLEEIFDAMLNKQPHTLSFDFKGDIDFEISNLEMQEHFDFYFPVIAKNNLSEIIFFINLTDNILLSPVTAQEEILGFLAIPQNAVIQFNTLLIKIDGVEKELNVLQFSLSYMEALLQKREESLIEYDMPFISAEELKTYYLNFKSLSLEQKYFLLALDENEEKAIGYIVEPDLTKAIYEYGIFSPET